MNKYLKSLFVMFVFIFLYEWLLHGIILKDSYQATASLWRPEAQMQKLLPFMFAGQFFIAFFVCLLFARSDSTRVKDFVIFGALIGALAGSGQVIMYSVAPYPMYLTVCWIIGGVIEFALAGYLFYLLNR